MPSSISSSPTHSPMSVLLVKIRPFFQRIIPLCEIFRVSRCPAYSIGGSDSGYGRSNGFPWTHVRKAAAELDDLIGDLFAGPMGNVQRSARTIGESLHAVDVVPG